MVIVSAAQWCERDSHRYTVAQIQRSRREDKILGET
jgi:hypothetical protein